MEDLVKGSREHYSVPGQLAGARKLAKGRGNRARVGHLEYAKGVQHAYHLRPRGSYMATPLGTRNVGLTCLTLDPYDLPLASMTYTPIALMTYP